MDSLNLVHMIKGYFTGGIANRFSTLLGESNQLSREKPAATATSPESGAQTYIVKRGDTLAKISKHFYGDTNGATRIFILNKNRLKNPNTLIVGQKLEIPAK